jgi:hypothetical protein
MLPLRPKCLFSKIIKSQKHRTVISFTFYFFFYGGSTRLKAMASYGVLRSHSLDTPQSVGLLWTSDRSDVETYTWHFTTLRGNMSILPAGFEPAIPASERPQNNAYTRPEESAPDVLQPTGAYQRLSHWRKAERSGWGKPSGPERNEIGGDWRKLHNSELYDLYWLNTIRLVK